MSLQTLLPKMKKDHLNMSYPPIYIINLKRTPERKLYMQRQLDALNLNYRFIEAIDKYDLVSKMYRATIARQLDIGESNMESLYEALAKSRISSDKELAFFRGLGVLGCLLSHVKVYNLMIDHNIPKACVLEDDAYLPPVFPEILVDAQKVPWDILMLSYSPPLFVRKIISSIFAEERRQKVGKISFSKLCRCFYRLMCYKIYYPHLNSYTVRRIISMLVKYLSWTVSIKPFNLEIKAQSGAYEKIIYGIGGIPIPDKSTWYRTVSNHYIGMSYQHRSNRILTTTAYMLTKSAAIQWKKEVVFGREKGPIDVMISRLNLKLYIFIPPCLKDTSIKKESTIRGDTSKINCLE